MSIATAHISINVRENTLLLYYTSWYEQLSIIQEIESNSKVALRSVELDRREVRVGVLDEWLVF